MALNTYAALQSTLRSFLQRADASADIPDMVAMFEAWVNRNVRHPRMEFEATANGAEYMALPADFLEMRDIQWQGSPRRQLDYLTPQQADRLDPFGDAGDPNYYTLIGDQLRLIPPPDDTTPVRMAYWRRIPALSGGNPTNWLLSLYPDAYVYGALMHGYARVNELSQASGISAAWGKVVAELQTQGRTSNVGSSLRIRCA